MIFKALGESLQIFTSKTSGSSGMDQASMLRETRGRIHYNVKTGLPDLASSRGTYEGHPTGSHSRETPAHCCLGCFGRTAPEECENSGRYQCCLGRLEGKVLDGATTDPVNRYVVIDIPRIAA